MKKSIALRLCAFLALSGGSAALPAAQQLYSNGTLIGAENVEVSGNYYTVSFMDGSCTSLFAGCDSDSDFNFAGLDAYNAALALREQVFGLGDQFDLQPGLTRGCTDQFFCNILIPFTVAATLGVDPAVAQTQVHAADMMNTFFAEDNIYGFVTLGRSGDTTNSPEYVYAVFSPGTPLAVDTQDGAVPEPGTWAMMLLGFGGMGVALRRRRRTGAHMQQQMA